MTDGSIIFLILFCSVFFGTCCCFFHGVWQTPRQLHVAKVYPTAIGNQPLDHGSGSVDSAPPYPESPSVIEQPPTYQAAAAHVTPVTDLP